MVQALPFIIRQGGDNRQFLRRQRQGKSVFLLYTGVAPAAGAVKLDDDRGGVFQPHLVDAVFVAVHGQDATVTAVTDGIQGVEDIVRPQVGVRGEGVHALIVP